ncbi:MAG: YicC family protein [Opitutales bacterium]|nr:YicC family protein [Opitutales bacterium]
MNSMTGFGRASVTAEGMEITIEMSSVNRRHLETSCSLPKEWQALERPLAELLRQRLARGKVHTNIQIETLPGSDALAWDDSAVKETVKRFKSLSQEVIEGMPCLDPHTLLKIVLLHKKSSATIDLETLTPIVTGAAEEALLKLCEMRSSEGAALKSDMSERINLLNNLLTSIRENANGTVERYRELLFSRLKQAGLELEIDDERVLKELALFADRCDIAEEITRLDSHLQQFGQTLDDTDPSGRKLEFILQEINREFNTIGSKANSIEISRCVIDAKNEIERIREQVQNVE